MSDIRFHVKRLIDDGWAVVPIKPGEKGATDGGWLKKARAREYTLDDFGADSNVGVVPGEPSGDRVDVDLDSPEAVAAAHALLPQTQLVHGRPSRPSTHWWFHVPKAVARVYNDPVLAELKKSGAVPSDAKTGLLEIRAGNGQTVLPPSTHSGEQLAWELEKAPLSMDVAAFERSVAIVAIVALLARYWPGKGNRHGVTLATAGFLGRYLDDPFLVEQMIRTVVTMAGDEEVELRAKAARDTLDKLATDGAKVTGAPKFRDEFPHGEKIAARILDWLGAEGADLIERLNERYFKVVVGTKPVVAEPTPDDILLWTFEDFDKRWCHEKVTVGKRQENAGKYWRESPRAARYERLVYAPPPAIVAPGDYNGWRGFAVEPAPGDWSRNRAHVRDVLARGDDRVFEWMLDWCAALFQRPGDPVETAIAMMGGQGIGKGHFADVMLGRSFDRRHYRLVIDRRRVYGEFNDILSGCCLLFLDEATWGGDKRDVGIIKGIVTSKVFQINRKHLPSVAERSMLHLILASNEAWPLGIDTDDRRWLILDVDGVKARNRAYFDALHEELDRGGRAAMLHDLLARRYDPGVLREPPHTSAKRDLKLKSTAPEIRWWFEKLHAGQILGFHARWEREVPKEALFDDYVTTLQKTGSARRAFETELGAMLARFAPGIKTIRRGSDRKRYWAFPALDVCRRAFDAAMQSAFDWPTPDDPRADLPGVDDEKF